MPRTAGDDWDVVTGVGATALLCAAARAAEARKSQPLARDELAWSFCSAVGDAGAWAQLNDRGFAQHFVNFQGARTRFIDDCVLRAVVGGVRQVVVVASGLDSRAFRLAWPTGMCFYELDMPAVLAWKQGVLASHRPRSNPQVRYVGVDLREDWVQALVGAGFDAGAPTVWIVEGLLIYLPGDAVARLFTGMDGLSAAGSVVCGNDSAPLGEAEFAEKVAAEVASGAPPHFQLLYNDRPASVVEWFSARGWDGQEVSVSDYLQSHGRPVPPASIARDTLVRVVKG